MGIGDNSKGSQSLEDSANAWGITLEYAPSQEDEDENFTVFYDGQLALKIFLAVQSQWNVGMAGITGLNYASVIEVIKLHANKKDRLNLLHEVSAIESGFLNAVNEKREKEKQ